MEAKKSDNIGPNSNHVIIDDMECYKISQWISDNGEKNKIGKGSFKTAYKYNDNTVVTMERLQPESLSRVEYDKLINKFYTLEPNHLKNVLVPFASGDLTLGGVGDRIQNLALCIDNGMVDMYSLLWENNDFSVTQTSKKTLLAVVFIFFLTICKFF